MTIELKNASRTYNRGFSVEEINLKIKAGVITSVLGKSGSGKSTLAAMAGGILAPKSGNVYADKDDIYKYDDKKRAAFRNDNIGYVVQGNSGLRSLTVLENVLLPTLIHGKKKSESVEKARNLLCKLGIEKLSDVYINELSGGELRRMAIARALINNPKIIIADEPTGDLDDDNTNTVLKLFRIYADNGAGILIITHDISVLDYSDESYIMKDGRLALQ